VSIVAQGCFHPVTKVQSASLHFFLGSDEDDEESDEEVCSWLGAICNGTQYTPRRKSTFELCTTSVRSTRKLAAVKRN
jgi:hypothetical protein